MFRALTVTTAIILVISAAQYQAQSVPSPDWAATAGYDYEVIPNVVYRRVGDWEGRLDLYLPAEGKKKNATLVWIHGGGWTRSSKEEEMLYFLPYLQAGWSVANVEYRLASAARAPAAVADCKCALKWLVRNAAKYRIDENRIVLSGISAGGHLALATALIDNVPWASSGECPGEAPKIAAVVNWFGPSDVTDLLAGANRFDQAIEWVGAGEEEVARSVSPVYHLRPGVPPVITIHGDGDEFIPHAQSVRLHKELTRLGVRNRLVTIRGRGHGDFRTSEWVSGHTAVRRFLKEFHR